MEKVPPGFLGYVARVKQIFSRQRGTLDAPCEHAGSGDPEPREVGEVSEVIEVIEAHLRTSRERPQGRPWVIANMVSSLDGAASLSGRSGKLAGAGDRAVFHSLRELPDAILVGASTVRAERYGPPRPRPDGIAPRLVIVSMSLDLPADLPAIAEAGPDRRPLILTGTTDREDALVDRLGDRVEVQVLDGDRVDPRAALAALADRGVGVVLCEGGPRLLGQLVAADLLDEWYVTIGAVAVVGGAHRITAFAEEVERRFLLRSVLQDGDDLFLAYERARSS